MRFLFFILFTLLTVNHTVHGADASQPSLARDVEFLRNDVVDKLQSDPAAALNGLKASVDDFLTQLTSLEILNAYQSQALADLLTLRHFTYDTALNEGIVVKSASGRPLIIVRDAFEQRLRENFDIPVFKNLDKIFSRNTWKGHVKYRYAGLNLATPAIYMPIETVTGAFSVDPSNTLTSCNSSGSVGKCNVSDVTYTFNKPTDISKMTAIVISVYPGMKSGFCWQTAPLNLPDKTIGAIGVKLPDCYSAVDQWDQFKESTFKDTHA